MSNCCGDNNNSRKKPKEFSESNSKKINLPMIIFLLAIVAGIAYKFLK